MKTCALTWRPVHFTCRPVHSHEDLCTSHEDLCTSHEDLCTSHVDLCTSIISRSILLRLTNVSDKSCRENQNTRSFCMLDNSDYTHTTTNILRIFNAYYFWRQCLLESWSLLRLYVHCMSCLFPLYLDPLRKYRQLFHSFSRSNHRSYIPLCNSYSHSLFPTSLPGSWF